MRTRSRTLVTLALTGLLAAGLAACGDDGDTTSTSAAGAGDGGDPAEVVVQVVEGGGFVTPSIATSTVPQVTVLADGTVLTPGIVPAIFPGPAVTPIQRATVTAADVDGLVETARSLGLLDGPLEFGQPPVSDAPTTTVTIVADGVTHTHEAYALSLEDSSIGADAQANRAALAEFVAAAQSIGVGDTVWTPTAYAVTVVGPAEVADPPQSPVDWPLEAAPPVAESFGCQVVEGADAEALAEALAAANSATPWVIDGAEYSLGIRPLVPGDAGCP